MSMTLEEMKLAVCEKLPKLIDTVPYWPHAMWTGNDGYLRQTIRWPTEGLQVCHEAEKIMDAEIFVIKYKDTLYTICGNGVAAINATYEQRLEALCRIWFPEKF